jgi:putative ABC transport system substrate-binding protein
VIETGTTLALSYDRRSMQEAERSMEPRSKEQSGQRKEQNKHRGELMRKKGLVFTLNALRSTLCLLCAVFFALCSSVEAQQKKMPQIGWLSTRSSPADSAEFPEKHALEGLRDLGWIEGKNVIIEHRYGGGNPERLSQMASELVRLNVDVIVTFSSGVAVAKRASGIIPIVMGTSQDPVRTGFVASLARPGGNLTGVTFLNDDLAGKRLELVKEAIPALSRAAIFWEPAHVDNEFKGMQVAAPGLGVRLQSVEVPRPARSDEVEKGIAAALEGHAEALILAPGGFTILHRKRVIELAARHRLPVFSAWRIFAEDGAVLTYGPDLDTARRIAYYVDRILKGANPADLPVEQPTKFEMVINLKTAKQIGMAIPPATLARADRVIR